MKNKNILVFGVCLISVLTCCFSIEAFEDQVVAIVNEDVITQEELDNYINFLQMQMSPEDWSKYGMSELKALESLIEDRIISQEAEKRDIEIDERAVEQKINKVRSGFRSEDEFLQALKFQGLSLSDLRKRVYEQLLINRFISYEIRSRIIVSPKEVTEFYQDHKEQFKVPEQVLVESISLEDQLTASEVFKKLKSGEDFAGLRERYSVRESLGLVDKGQLKEDIEEAIFNLSIGEFSEPLHTDEGYYIFLAKSKKEESYKDLIEVQSQISDLISNMKYNMRLKSWIEKFKESSYISIKI